MVCYSFYLLVNNTEQQIWLLLLTLTGVTALFLLIPDLIWGGWRSIVLRYLWPCLLGIILAVSYLLATKISSKSTRANNLWLLFTVVLISGGVLSCAISSQGETWWGSSKFTVESCRRVNQTSYPLVISDDRKGQVMPLSYCFEPKVQMMLVRKSNIPDIPDGFTNLFLFNPSARLRYEVERNLNGKIKLVYQTSNDSLWQVKKL